MSTPTVNRPNSDRTPVSAIDGDAQSRDDLAVASAEVSETVSVVSEDVTFSKVQREIGGVRVRIEASERLAEAAGPIVTSTVEVERVARNQVVTETRTPWQDGDTLVVPVYREEWVQVRQLLLVEEVRLQTRRATEVQRLDVPLREERAVVERQGRDGVWRDLTTHATPDGPSGGVAIGQEPLT